MSDDIASKVKNLMMVVEDFAEVSEIYKKEFSYNGQTEDGTLMVQAFTDGSAIAMRRMGGDDIGIDSFDPLQFVDLIIKHMHRVGIDPMDPDLRVPPQDAIGYVLEELKDYVATRRV